MKRLLKLIPFVLIFSISTAAFGYKEETHEEMSEHAARRSVLSQDVLSDIGLAGTLDTVVLSDGSINATVLGWIRYGAYHEDDTISSVFTRYVNHFYNPLNGQGYSLFPGGYPSPLWGLENQAACPPPYPCNPVIDGQNYSLRDARDYLYSGLTLLSATERENNLALTFRALGQVMHLVQDAGQPQHTRNDSHGITGTLYESFTNQFRDTLLYDGYPSATSLVKFNTVLSFWHTLTPPQIDIQAGQGIAEYSNRSFVSTGTNFRFDGTNVITDPNFPVPAYDSLTGYSYSVAEMLNTMPTCSVITNNLQGQLIFYGNMITDSYTTTSELLFNQYLTTLSILDADLQETGERFFSLNRFNFCAAQDRLIPRAVGYSGGLLDYFFRGKLEANYTEAGQLTITVKNISGPTNTIHDGTFELYYDAIDTTRKSLAIIDGASVGSPGIVDGDSWVITANLPPIGDLDTSKSNPYMLVYRGIVGSEEAVVGKVLQTMAIKIYVVDQGNSRVEIFNGSGIFISQFGSPNSAQIGVAVDASQIYVSDYSNNRIQIFAKTTGLLVAEFNLPDTVLGVAGRAAWIAADETKLYVTDANNPRVLIFTKSGTFLSEFELVRLVGADWVSGSGISVDENNIYVNCWAYDAVNDSYYAEIQIFEKNGLFVRKFLWHSNATFYPDGIAIDAAYIYIANAGEFNILIYTKDGVFVSSFGGPGVNPGEFDYPVGIAVDNKKVYVTDSNNQRVQIFTKSGVFISTFGSGSGPGPGQFWYPWGIAVGN